MMWYKENPQTNTFHSFGGRKWIIDPLSISTLTHSLPFSFLFIIYTTFHLHILSIDNPMAILTAANNIKSHSILIPLVLLLAGCNAFCLELTPSATAIRHDCPSSDGSVLSSMNSSSSFSNTASRCPSNSNPSILWSGWVLAGYGGLSVVELTAPYLYPTLMVRSADPISLPAVVVSECVGRDTGNRCTSTSIPFIDW